MPPKSILKKPLRSSPLNPDTPSPSQNTPPPPQNAPVSTSPPPQNPPLPSPSEARLIALSHAHALQIRKSLEHSILLSLEALLDHPQPAPTTTPLQNTTHFKRHLRFFQPADYDSLLEERALLHLCAYALCANATRHDPSASTYVLVDKGRATMRFVPRARAARFCSDACARRALWVRVQLQEEPSWLRAEVVDGVSVGERGEVSGLDLDGERWEAAGGLERVMLLEEGGEAREGVVGRLVEELRGLGIEGGVEKVVEAVAVVEKEVVGVPVPPVEGVVGAIEGYVPRSGS